MINKVERLTSIGKFRDYQATGQVNFKKLTLIYGDNGGGKTTLTSVLRSLTTNKPEILRNRLSTNHSAPQSAQITQVGVPTIFHTFGAGGWSLTFPDIEIFDIHFVNDNIYSGCEFNEDHRKQLHQFVIGAQGVALQQQIEQNKADKSDKKKTIAELEQQLIQEVGNGLSLDLIPSFLSLRQNNNIEELISTAQIALSSASANSVIQSLQPLSTLKPIILGIDFTSIIRDLESTSETIRNEVLETLFQAHCQDLTSSIIEPENWLLKGFSYIQSKLAINNPNISCPFCKQNIEATSDILTAYISKFDAAFNDLVSRIQRHLSALNNFNIQTTLQQLSNINKANSERVASWITYLPKATQPTYDTIIDETKFISEFTNIITSVQQKSKNPTAAIESNAITLFQSSLIGINDKIALYNEYVSTYNNSIAEFRASIQTVAAAQLSLDALNRNKMRFEPSINALCTQLADEKRNLRNLETAYTQLSQQQQSAATAFFNQYQGRINYYLGDIFKTPFRVENVIHVAPHGRAVQSKLSYKLTIDGKDISFTGHPLFAKDCLSEGDKSTIALAFFLSKLDIDPNLQNKVLVFDDPLSSLDANRRTYTVGIIRSLFDQLKQVIVLSHNEHFLYDIGMKVSARDKVTLRIKEDFVAKASSLEPCDLDELVKIEYFKQIEALERYRSNPDFTLKESVLGWLRNVLEANLRFKFYKEIRFMSGVKTFGRLIDFLDSYPATFRDNAHRGSIISSLHQINGVSWKVHHGDPAPNYSSLGMNPNTITAPELDHLIQDTLNLIESRI